MEHYESIHLEIDRIERCPVAETFMINMVADMY